MFDLFNLANNNGKQVKIGGKTFGSQEQVTEEVKTESRPTAVNVPKESPVAASTIEEKVPSSVQADANTPSTIDAVVVTANDPNGSIESVVLTATEEQPAAALTDTAKDAKQANEVVDVNSIFGDLQKQVQDAKAQQKKESTKKSADKKQTVTSSNTVKPNDFSNINEETLVRMGFDSFPITDFFTVEELEHGISTEKADGKIETRKICSEDLRFRMEKAGFVTLVSGFVTLEYFGGNRNFVMIIPQAKKKGATLEVQSKEVRSSIDPTSFFINKYGKLIPFKLLDQFYNVAKLVGKMDLEVLGEIYFNFDTLEFSLYIPHQDVHRYWCIATEEGEYQRQKMMEGYHVELACAIHSHHFLRCHPSSQDDESERIPYMAYAIIGEFSRNKPAVYTRTFDGQQHIPVDPLCFFEDGIFSEKDDYRNLPYFRANWLKIHS